MRQLNPNLNLPSEKITNLPFDEIIGHSECERQYFTIENNDIIYARLKNETKIVQLPYLGPCVDFGLGDICLEENLNIFKFYIIDRAQKFNYEEFTSIEEAVEKLVNCYKEYGLIDDPQKMRTIFNEILNLNVKTKI